MRPIGVFDSGYGGLTILKQIRQLMPQYDYLYLGDNARAPYGSRSFEVVYAYTLQAVTHLFEEGCPLVIIACNTASAKALRTIQQRDLPLLQKRFPQPLRVLGIIRPTVEEIGNLSHTHHVGILATQGTISSQTYDLEIHKLHPDIVVTGQACPMWVPLVEYQEAHQEGADYFVQRYINELLQRDAAIDTIILGCTHYPILFDKIRRCTPSHISLMPQGEYVAASLKNYLHRHPEINLQLTTTSQCVFSTTEDTSNFDALASTFMGEPVHAIHVPLS